MTSRKSLSQNRLPKDRILYCDRCGISFLWSGEEQQVGSRPSIDNQNNDTPEASPQERVQSGTLKPPTRCAGCRFLLPSEGRERGLVKWYNPRKRFGFITRDDGREIFVHGSRLKNAKRLRDGSLVEFWVTESNQGPAAIEIHVLDESPSTI